MVLLLASSLPALEPPRPGELERYKADGTLARRIAQAERLGNNKVSPYLVAKTRWKLQQEAVKAAGLQGTAADQPVFAPPPNWQGGLPSHGTPKVVVLLVDFPDAAHDNNETVADVQNKFFSDGDATELPYESLRNFYQRASYNQLTIQGDVLGWYRAANNRDYYANLDYPDGYEALVKEALNFFDTDGQGHDFTQYDTDNNGTIDGLYLKWAGPDNGWANFWWASQPTWTGDPSYRIDGKKIGKYVWSWIYNQAVDGTSIYQAHTDIHETGHLLGLPDLYDYYPGYGPDGGVGGLDMMDNVWGDHNCFSKFMLDWLTPTYVTTGSQTIALAPSGTSQDCVLIMPSALYTTGTIFDEFFMVQYRKRGDGNDPIGAHGAEPPYPADGFTIWHIDSTLNASKTDFKYDNSMTAHKMVRLMEADGLEEIENDMMGGYVANAGDFYVPNKTFGDKTTPNNYVYTGGPGYLLVDQLTSPGATMSARFSITQANVTSVTASNPDGTYQAGATIDIQVLFSANVTVMGAPRLALNTTPAGRYAGYVSGSGTNTLSFAYTVQAGDASDHLDYASATALTVNGGAIQNSAGFNAVLTLPEPGSDGSLGYNKNIVIDAAPPRVVSLSAPSPTATFTGPVTYTVFFSEVVVGFSSGDDIQLDATGTAAAGSVTVSGIGAGPYLVTLSNLTGDGRLQITVKAGACHDAVGHDNLASEASATCKVGHVPPTVTSISDPSTAGTRSGPVTYTLDFSDPVTGFDSADDIQVNATGTAAAASVSVSGSSAGPYTVTLADLTGDGTLGFTVKAGVCVDIIGNANTASAASPTFAVDNTPPAVVSIGLPSAVITNTGPVGFTVRFSEPVTGFNSGSAIQVNATGTAEAGSVSVSESGDGLYTVTLSSIKGNGALGITVNAGACADLAGNVSLGSSASSSFAVDNIAPTVAEVSEPSVPSTSKGPVSFDVSFSEPVVGFDSGGDIQVNSVGTAGAGSVTVSGSGAGPYTVTLANITGDGALGITVKGGACADAAGNNNATSTASSMVPLDNTGPIVTWVSPPLESSTVSGPVSYTVAFDGPVIGFESGNGIQVNATDTAAAGSVTVGKTSGGTYLVTLGSITGSGTLGITVMAGACTDVAGNENAASSPSETFDVGGSGGGISLGLCGTGVATLAPLTGLALVFMRLLPSRRRSGGHAR